MKLYSDIYNMLPITLTIIKYVINQLNSISFQPNRTRVNMYIIEISPVSVNKTKN